MQKDRQGFDYYLTRERIQAYQEKPPKLRLAWLYFGNLLRKQYPERIIKLQDTFRNEKEVIV
ncbi:hypothetical protein KKG61_09605 [bacterium]|nr:hypothetical protein [bacterium]MBU1600339.1 hypothetical protein [bacterium]MBU2462233.1 hypothetical protein [bacterium]